MGTYFDSDGWPRGLDHLYDFFTVLVVDGSSVDLQQSVSRQQACVVAVLDDGSRLSKDHSRQRVSSTATRIPLYHHGAAQGKPKIIARRRLARYRQHSRFRKPDRLNFWKWQVNCWSCREKTPAVEQTTLCHSKTTLKNHQYNNRHRNELTIPVKPPSMQVYIFLANYQKTLKWKTCSKFKNKLNLTENILLILWTLN